MITLRIIAFGFIAVGVISAFIKRTNKWALALQRYFINQPKNLFTNNERWKQPVGLIICKVMVAFLGFVLIVGAYALCFAGLGQ
jgi:hypothetical protein